MLSDRYPAAPLATSICRHSSITHADSRCVPVRQVWECPLHEVTNESLQKLNQNLELQIEARTKSLAASEQRYRMLVEQAKDLIYNIDKEGYFLYVNSIGIQQFGYADEDIIGKRFLDISPTT